MRRRRLWFAVTMGIYVGAMGFLGGVLVERVRFDRARATVLERVAYAEQRLHARLMELEREQQPAK
jgi:hypothetical protein